ncbi:MAG: DUF1553 domain-containing protein [Pirellulaceae bacterium]
MCESRYALPLFVALLAAFAIVRTSDAAEASVPLRVTPPKATLVGPLARVQLVCATDERADVTREATYESLTPQVASVDATGLVAPLADGDAKIRVSLNGLAVEVSLQVVEMDAYTASFRHDVMPILSRGGCAGGSCHAAQYGQAGFKLSLLGYAPEQDYTPIVRDEIGRRISLVKPEDSLILLKATQQTPHGGGRRFDIGDYDYDVLMQWLTDETPGPAKDEAEIVDLTVTPGERVYRPGESQQLRVVAHYSDGGERDVTQAVMYDTLNDAVATVGPRGYLTAQGSGQAAVMIRYMGQAKISMVIVPFAEKTDLSDFKPANFIDELVMQRWKLLGLEPSGGCSDQEFLRRVFLDAIGTLPSPEKVEAFLADDDPHKREALVDELLGLTGDPARDIYVNEWSAYWALKWGDLLRNNRNKLGDGGMWAMYNWTRASLRENKPVDRFVRELITAEGSVFSSGPANYYKVTNKPDELAETTAQNFLGVRLQCAKCHHHPFEVYSQADYYSLAAFFTRVGTKNSSDFGALGRDTVVLVKRSGSIRHPRTGQTMEPAPLLGEPVETQQLRDLRRPLAQWLTSPENELFARNIVNRFWGYYMGTGLVEPLDDMRATNPPSNPELLDALAKDFVEGGFDLRRLMRSIMTSQAYQRSSRPTDSNAADTRFYTHYNVKRLPAEVLLDAVDDACGTQEKFTGIPAGTRAIELPDPNYASFFLDTMGRPQRVITCECERATEPNLAQVLHIANGDVLQKKVSDNSGRVARMLKQKELDDETAIAQLYLHTFSRRPSEEELVACREILAAAENRGEGLEDILWALCNSREFLFNH